MAIGTDGLPFSHFRTEMRPFICQRGVSLEMGVLSGRNWTNFHSLVLCSSTFYIFDYRWVLLSASDFTVAFCSVSGALSILVLYCTSQRTVSNSIRTSWPSSNIYCFVFLLRWIPLPTTGWARLNRSLSSVRFYFELSGNSNYIIHCKSNYVQNFELEINSIWNFNLGFTSNYCFELWLPSS